MVLAVFREGAAGGGVTGVLRSGVSVGSLAGALERSAEKFLVFSDTAE
ncbi:hypothetical protein ACFQNE_11900 [Gordonia phosphorivorans]|uniref:Uncharacterized protein n=1 Tax=Gordonia phosphorivorans TaxID=1056982 RepID=A0ABV6HB53_9ACTN